MAGGGGGSEELNLIPYLDIMVNLIMFLIVITAYIAEMKEVEVLAPGGPPPDGGTDTEDKPPPFLTIAIYSNGFALLGSDPAAVPAWQVEKQGGEYPYAALQAQLKNYKDQYKLAENLMITADGKIPYAIVVKTMDAARTDAKGASLFPGVTLGVVTQGK
jgi:biopolymer transport protein ExbD